MREGLNEAGKEKTLQERIVEQYPEYQIARDGLLVIESRFYIGGQIKVRPEGIARSLPKRKVEPLSTPGRDE